MSTSERAGSAGEPMKRVVYTNRLDGKRRVLVGQLAPETADKTAKVWGDPLRKEFYLGPVSIEECDGTPDGAVLP